MNTKEQCKWCGSSKHDSNKCHVAAFAESVTGKPYRCDGKLENCGATTHQEYLLGKCWKCDK